jgi:hypothetical protein
LLTGGDEGAPVSPGAAAQMKAASIQPAGSAGEGVDFFSAPDGDTTVPPPDSEKALRLFMAGVESAEKAPPGVYDTRHRRSRRETVLDLLLTTLHPTKVRMGYHHPSS